VAADALCRDRLAHKRQPVVFLLAFFECFEFSTLRRKPFNRGSEAGEGAATRGIKVEKFFASSYLRFFA
jgi:hypothetical protein